MTLKEAKKILESEGFVPERFLGVLVEDVKAASWEKIEVGEAMKVVAENGYFPFMEKSKYEERKARLKKEYEKNTKAPGSGEEQSKEGDLKAAIKMFGAQAREIMRLTAENTELRETIDKMKEGNPALKEALAESASQFNDALLDEQAKKIAELTKENERLERVSKTTTDEFNELYYRMITKSDKIEALGKEIAKLNGIIHKKNLKIEELGKESSRHLEGKMKMFGENVDLEQELKDKDAVLADVAEELRLSKIREKNLTEVSQKYMKANEELKEKLANKVVDKINAQALKSAESALAYKEKVIAEKDDVIADLTHKLKDKHKRYVWYKGTYLAAQQILNTIADYASKHPDKKFSDPMVEENHPTIDNPEEIEIEKAVKLVRKAMKEGHKVTIDYKD
jgi:chromosome segregation ATPase